jgi:hypothetical protein
MSTQDQTLAPSDLEIALFLRREQDRLPGQHHEFVDYAVSRLERPCLTLKQREYLHKLFAMLGGKIT